ncbi:MAG: response regulator [Fibrobacterota bacterium]
MAVMNVLIADDDPAVVDIISVHLKTQGYGTLRAGNGLEAWEIYNDKNPDVVITDLNMPQMPGGELVSKIKQKNPRTITIVLTGEGSMESAISVMRSGCDDYLLKPIQDLNRLSFVIMHSIERRNLLTRSLLQSRVSWAKSEYINRLCDELSNPAYCLLSKTETLVKVLEKSGANEALSLAKEIQSFTETLVEISGRLCDDTERLKLVEKQTCLKNS